MNNYLPSEIIIDVLSRLPVRSVACCKCVCKSWLHLVETDEFVKTHLSKSVPGLLISSMFFDLKGGPNLLSHGEKPVAEFNLPNPYHRVNYGSFHDKFFDLEVAPDLLSYEEKPAAVFNLPSPNCRVNYGSSDGSSDGLLFLRDNNLYAYGSYICNPITREYIEIHCPQDSCGVSRLLVTYGFGKSKITGQYKVVRIYQGYLKSDWHGKSSECQIYTLGIGSWRIIAPGPTFKYRDCPAFFSGNLHWLVSGSNRVQWICCFNLETELFSTFSVPNGRNFVDVYALGDYLCLNEDTLDDEFSRVMNYGVEKLSDGSSIWVMKEYGDEKSWKKEVISFHGRLSLGNAILHTPSFLSLKSFVGEKVCSY